MTKYISLFILTLSFTAFSASDAVTTIPENDAEIVNMLMTLNTEEMNLSKLGQSKAKSPKIKDFSRKMMKAHAQNNDEAAALRRKQKISMTETKRSKTLKTNVENTIEILKKEEAKSFDQSYMAAQVSVHQKALQSLETTLIPNSKNEQLKAMLQETKKHVESHLKEAQELQSTPL